MENNTQFKQENDALLFSMLERKYFSRLIEKNGKPAVEIDGVEFYLTATCNQKCEYCYLEKYGHTTYPDELRDEKTIVRNVELMLDYFKEKNMYVHCYSLFSGEIWGTAFSDKVFQKFERAFKAGLKFDQILIPSNMSFLMNQTFRENIEHWIYRFKKIGVDLHFSASVDGAIIEEKERSFKDESRNEERKTHFYDLLFRWCRDFNFNYHPMVAAGSIEDWCDNYDWWQEMFAKYDENPWMKGMYLEVRNDEWTAEKIKHYLNYLNHTIDYDFEHYCFGDARIFAKAVFSGIVKADESERMKITYRGYLIQPDCHSPGCTIDKDLMIRMGDLAIGPCHRTFYPQLIYGKFVIEGTGNNQKITGVSANNIQLANLFYNNTDKCYMRCNACPIGSYCMKQCFGAQYESSGEILLPVTSVCNLYKARLVFLSYKYRKLFQKHNTTEKQWQELQRVHEAARKIEMEGFNLCEYLEAPLQRILF